MCSSRAISKNVTKHQRHESKCYRGGLRLKDWIAVALFSVLPLLAACDSVVETGVEEEKIEKLTAEELAYQKKLEQAALVLVEVAKDREAVAAVRQSIKLRRAEGFDEDVPFARLLGRDTRGTSGEQYVKIAQPFARAFRAALQKQEGFSNVTTGDGFDLEAFLADSAKIYWPYAEDFEGTETPALVAHPMDESVEAALGYAPTSADSDGQQSNNLTSSALLEYTEVMIDESYAQSNATWVVVPAPIPYPDPIPQPAPDDDTEPSGSVVRVSLGWVQCRQQFDTFWSGGSELRFVRVEPNAINGELESSKTEIEVNASRKDCGRKRWKEVKTAWDSNWEKEDKDQGFVVYEWDRFTWGGEWDYSLGYEGDAGVEGLEIDTQVEGTIKFNNGGPVYKTTINRDSYLAFNDTDLDLLGTRDGFGIRGAGTGVRFTFPHNLYSPPSIVIANDQQSENSK